MKGNRFSDTIREFARKLTDDDLRFLHMRLSQRIGADISEAVDFLQRSSDVDHWLSLSKNATDFYDMIDAVDVALQMESKRRYSAYEPKKKREEE